MWDHPAEIDNYDLRCPITQVCFRNVALAADGFHYERMEIERWFSENRPYRSPTTGAPIPTNRVYPDEHKQAYISKVKSKCIRSFTQWWESNKHSETVESLATSLLKLSEIADPKDCISLLTDVDKFNLLAYNTNDIIAFMRSSGVLCCLCGNRLSGHANPSLCSECMWEFLRGNKLVGCMECGNHGCRSNDDCNVCGPMPKLIKAHLRIDPSSSGLNLKGTSSSIVVTVNLEHIHKHFGTCIQIIKVVKWSVIEIITQDTNRKHLKAIHDIISVMPGMYENLTIDCS